MWYASSCSGTTISDRRQQRVRLGHLDQEVLRRIEQIAGCSSCPSVVSAMTEPPRAFTSWMLPIIFSNTWSCGAIVTTGMLLVDERDRPVLHLAGRIALGVDVGDLLQLQRAFERDRVVDAAAEVEEVAARGRSASAISSIVRRQLQRLLEQQRQLQQRVDVRLRRLRRQRAAHLAEVQRQQVAARRAAR